MDIRSLVDHVTGLFGDSPDITYKDVLDETVRKEHPEYANVPDDVLAAAAAKNEPAKYGHLAGFKADAKVDPELVPQSMRTDKFYQKNPTLATQDATAALGDIRKQFPEYAKVPDDQLAAAAEQNAPDKYKGLVAKLHAPKIEQARAEAQDKVLETANATIHQLKTAIGYTSGAIPIQKFREGFNTIVSPAIEKAKAAVIKTMVPSDEHLAEIAQSTGRLDYGAMAYRTAVETAVESIPSSLEGISAAVLIPEAAKGAATLERAGASRLAGRFPVLSDFLESIYGNLKGAHWNPEVMPSGFKPPETQGPTVKPPSEQVDFTVPEQKALPAGETPPSLETRPPNPSIPPPVPDRLAPRPMLPAGGVEGPGFRMQPGVNEAALAERARYSPKAGEIVTREGYKPNGPSEALQKFESSLPPEHQAMLQQLRAGVKGQAQTRDLFFDHHSRQYTPERQAIHNKIEALPEYNKPEAKPPEGVPPTARIVIGPPAAGKSSGMKALFGEKSLNRSILLDNDEIKAQLPGWNPHQAELFHQESSDIEEGIARNAMKNGYDITQSILGKNSQKVQRIMDIYRRAGYRVELYHVDLPAEKAAGRAITRAADGGRFVDPAYVIDEVGLKPSQTYDKLKKEADKYGRVSSDVEKGAPLVPLETGEGTPALRSGRVPNGRTNSGTGTGISGEASQPAAAEVTLPGYLPGMPLREMPRGGATADQVPHDQLLDGFQPQKPDAQGDLFSVSAPAPAKKPDYQLADNALMVPVKDFKTSPERFQPRRGLIESRVQALAQVMQETGYKAAKPVTAWQDPKDGKLYVLAGHHRLAAAQRAGLKEIPTIIEKGTEADAIALARRSNSTRAPMTPIEEARAYKAEADAGAGLEQISKNYGGVKTSEIQRKLELNNLSKGLQDLVDQGQFPTGHAIELGRAAREYDLSDTVQNQIFDEIVKKMDVTPAQFRTMLDTLGPAAAKQIDMGFDFKIDQGILTPLREMANKMGSLEKAKRQLSGYVKYTDSAIKAGEKVTKAQLSARNTAERQVARLQKEIIDQQKSVGKAAKAKMPDLGKLYPEPASAETGAVSLGADSPSIDLGNGKVATFKREIYDRFEPIKYKAGEEIDPAHPSAGGKYTEAYVMARELKGKIRAGGEELLKELNTIVQPLENNADRQVLNKIYTLRNFADLDRIGKTTSGVTADMANKLLADLKTEIGPERFDRISKVADNVADLQNNKALDILIDGKVITPEAAEALRQRYPHYLRSEILDEKLSTDYPQFRSSDNGEPIGRINKSFLKTKQGTKKLINTDVLDVVRRSLVTKVAAAEKQQVVDQIVQQFGTEIGSRQLVDGQVITKVNPKAIPPGYVRSNVKASGDKIYALRADIEQMLQGLNKHEMDMITRAIGSYNRFFKAGATTYRAPFVLSNFSRDIQEVLFKGRSIPGQANKAMSYARALLSSVKEAFNIPDATFDAWARGGGAHGGIITSIPQDVRIPFRLLEPKQQMNRAAGFAFSIPFKAIEIPGAILENTSRLAEYLRLKPTDLPESLKILNSRDVTVDFEKMGDAMRVYNTYIPFLNPAAQGAINIGRAFRDQPGVSAAKLAAYIAIPTAALYTWNRRFKNDDTIDPYLKDNWWYINTGAETLKDGRKVPILLTVKKGETAQIFSNQIQSLLEYASKDKNFQTRLDQWDPGGIARSAVSFVLPPLLKEPIEQVSNYDFFQQRPIIPERLKDVASKYQFSRGTSNAARRAGEITGASPIRLEHALSGIWPAAKQVTSLVDALINPAPEFPKKKGDVLEGSRAFQPFVRTPSGYFSQDEEAARRFDRTYTEGKRTPAFLFKESMQRFYESKDPADLETAKKYAREIDPKQRQAVVQQVRKDLIAWNATPERRSLLKMGKKERRFYARELSGR